MGRPRTIILIITAFCISGVFLVWLFIVGKQHSGIPSSLPDKYVDQPVLLIDKVNYLQNDPRWNDTPLGTTHETIGQVGCTLSSVAMSLQNMGYDFTPLTLNASITDVNGYTERGWIKWVSIEQVTHGRAQVDYYQEPSHDIINRCLRRGQYPIVKFLIKGVIPHWVVVTGRTKTDYRVRDPLVEASGPISLRSRTSNILAVRCVRDSWSFIP